ncbi:hypothetical protein DFJ77DRAFT_464874 [Powellomyces hirtus]|nr:hypothetical protein DFJ77DRAFT_464874 [Powellomyces hirtus]
MNKATAATAAAAETRPPDTTDAPETVESSPLTGVAVGLVVFLVDEAGLVPGTVEAPGASTMTVLVVGGRMTAVLVPVARGTLAVVVAPTWETGVTTGVALSSTTGVVLVEGWTTTGVTTTGGTTTGGVVSVGPSSYSNFIYKLPYKRKTVRIIFSKVHAHLCRASQAAYLPLSSLAVPSHNHHAPNLGHTSKALSLASRNGRFPLLEESITSRAVSERNRVLRNREQSVAHALCGRGKEPVRLGLSLHRVASHVEVVLTVAFCLRELLLALPADTVEVGLGRDGGGGQRQAGSNGKETHGLRRDS